MRPDGGGEKFPTAWGSFQPFSVAGTIERPRDILKCIHFSILYRTAVGNPRAGTALALQVASGKTGREEGSG